MQWSPLPLLGDGAGRAIAVTPLERANARVRAEVRPRGRTIEDWQRIVDIHVDERGLTQVTVTGVIPSSDRGRKRRVVFTARASDVWPRLVGCHVIVTGTFWMNLITKGSTISSASVDEDSLKSLAGDLGLITDLPYPGTHHVWVGVCRAGHKCAPRLTNLTKGQGPCLQCRRTTNLTVARRLPLTDGMRPMQFYTYVMGGAICFGVTGGAHPSSRSHGGQLVLHYGGAALQCLEAEHELKLLFGRWPDTTHGPCPFSTPTESTPLGNDTLLRVSDACDRWGLTHAETGSMICNKSVVSGRHP